MSDTTVINKTEHPKFGELMQTFEMKDENHLYMYTKDNMIYFVRNDVVEKSFRKDNIGELVGAFMSLALDSDDESEEI